MDLFSQARVGGTEEQWEGRPQRREKMEKPKVQSEGGRRESQRRNGQGHMGNNKSLVELRAAEMSLGAGAAPILITFLLGLWPVTNSAALLLPTLIPLSPFSTPIPTCLPAQLGVESLSGWVESAWSP